MKIEVELEKGPINMLYKGELAISKNKAVREKTKKRTKNLDFSVTFQDIPESFGLYIEHDEVLFRPNFQLNRPITALFIADFLIFWAIFSMHFDPWRILEILLHRHQKSSFFVLIKNM